MASKASDDIEKEWTFVDKDGKIDIQVSQGYRLFLFSSLVIVKVLLIFPRLVLATKQLNVLIWSTAKITKLQTNTTGRN